MALIQCPECSQEISDCADVCIKCGFPLNKSKPVSTKCNRCNTVYYMDDGNLQYKCPKCGLLGPDNPTSRSVQKVEVVEAHMPFWSMVSFMVWWVIASIPAFIILSIISGIFFVIYTAVIGYFTHHY